MRLLRTTLLYVLPIAFAAILSKYGFRVDGAELNFTW
ncbi:MAG: hypothetical protein QOH95_700 [Gaiellaceae bacterium]|jgi:hypothetical protein|nr:hypothetical protein [Gaiellaceae bacterium]